MARHTQDKRTAAVTAFDVANYFRAKTDPSEGEVITHLKLQKLVYYAQGFHLAVYNEPLFKEDIEAWRHGPVVPELYHALKGYGFDPIPPAKNFDASVFSDEQRELLDEIWETYGQFSAIRLRDMTHAEPPWKEADARGFNDVITHQALREYFLTQIVEDE